MSDELPPTSADCERLLRVKAAMLGCSIKHGPDLKMEVIGPMGFPIMELAERTDWSWALKTFDTMARQIEENAKAESPIDLYFRQVARNAASKMQEHFSRQLEDVWGRLAQSKTYGHLD